MGNGDFWRRLTDYHSGTGQTSPDVMLGDLNIVEDSIDWIPTHPDNATATAELQKLRDKIKVIDWWRHTHPNEKCFTFQADATGYQSRIDQIYVSRAIYDDAFEWDISDTAIRTDHRLTTVQVATPNTPESGPGCWSMPVIVIKDKGFMKSAIGRGTGGRHSPTGGRRRRGEYPDAV